MVLTDVDQETAKLYLHAKAKLGDELKEVGVVSYTGMVVIKLTKGGAAPVDSGLKLGSPLGSPLGSTRSALGSGSSGKKNGQSLEFTVEENFSAEELRRQRTLMEIGGSGAAPYQAVVWQSAYDFFAGKAPDHSGLVDSELEKGLGLASGRHKKFIERYPDNSWYLPGEKKA